MRYIAWILVVKLICVIPLVKAAQSACRDSLPVPPATDQRRKCPSKPAKPALGSPDLPVYHPPQRGAPAGRVAGGSRSAEDDLPLLSALAPNHTGLSVHAQPTLYWYLTQFSVRHQA